MDSFAESCEGRREHVVAGGAEDRPHRRVLPATTVQAVDKDECRHHQSSSCVQHRPWRRGVAFAMERQHYPDRLHQPR